MARCSASSPRPTSCAWRERCCPGVRGGARIDSPTDQQQGAVMDIRVTFPGDMRVDADLGTHVIRTDQSPAHGGGGRAPEPFELFLASLATCAGAYVAGFCRARDLSTAGIALVQRHRFD